MTTPLLFMGSPDFALPPLLALLNAPDFEVVAVVTQPDRPAGRGGKLRQPPVKTLALEFGVDIYQPEKLRGPEAEAMLRAFGAELFVVAAYGQILRQSVLDIPKHGCINVHASLLPRWRGAAPIQAAIRAGDAETGITIMGMDAGLDTGPMLLKESIAIAPDDTGGTLHDKLAEIGGPLLLRALRGYLSGEITPQAQDDALTTYAPQLKKEDGQIDWTQDAETILHTVRAFEPWPGTFSQWEGRLLKLFGGVALPASDPELVPGIVREGDDEHPLYIGTGAGWYAPDALQLAGKKRLSAADFLNGNADIIGAVLGE